MIYIETDFHEAQPIEAEGQISARISNPDAENGFPQDPGPLDWLNSARITADAEDDAVRCVVSVGDPRGGFCFTVRRIRDGRLVVHVPHPGEGMAHMDTKWDHPGTLIVGHGKGDEFTPGDFSSDKESEAEDD